MRPGRRDGTRISERQSVVQIYLAATAGFFALFVYRGNAGPGGLSFYYQALPLLVSFTCSLPFRLV